jgi:hypothetical protein
MEKAINLHREHQENVELASKINFYKDEIRILKNRLVDLSKELSKQNDLKEVERLQNQLEIQENNANNISHAIRNNEKIIDKVYSKGPGKDLKHRPEQHQKEIDLVDAFEKNFKEIRKSIKELASH